MIIQDFQNAFEKLVPPAIAWKGDNVGLLIGKQNDPITNVIVALDATLDVAKEAKKKKANLVVTHHPLLFHPLRNITSKSRVGELVLYFIENKINLYSAHTNLDSVNWGVNFALAETLLLKSIKILSPIKESLNKIVVFVPSDHTENVSKAMHDAGAGMFSKYDHCSFRSEGTGTFRGMGNAQPFIGKVGKLETVKEIRLEMLCESWKLRSVISAMLANHPYEEVAYDVYPLLNANTEYGIGAIGDLSEKMTEENFLAHVQKKLGTKVLRFTKKNNSVRRVAVCGGSGTEFISDAIQQNADAMVTADLKYHTFQEYENRLLLIDAGHFETENIVLPKLAKKIEEILDRKESIGKVIITKKTTNPVYYYL